MNTDLKKKGQGKGQYSFVSLKVWVSSDIYKVLVIMVSLADEILT